MLQNPSAVPSSAAANAGTAAAAATALQPKVIVIRRRPNQGFGFTLRHFIAYPPEDDPSWLQEASEPYQVKAMETIFIKEVQPNGPAHYANLQTGDRVLMVNNQPIAGIAYSTIVSMIKQTPSVLTLHVVPKECDVLQMHYTSIAHTPETNRLALIPKPVNLLVGNGSNGVSAKTFQTQQLISYAPTTAPIGSGSRSSSITSNTSSSGVRPVITSSNSLEYNSGSMPEAQHASNAATLLMRGDGTFIRSQPPNLTVLARQQHQQQLQLQHQQQQQQLAFYSPNSTTGSNGNNGGDNTDLMIRLRESIKQKEEFLKSPLPHVHQGSSSTPQQQSQQAQHFFPHTPPGGSPQLNSAAARAQLRSPLVKQPLSASAATSSTTSCDMQNYYARSVPTNFMSLDSALISRSGNNAELIKPTSYAQLSRSQRQTNIVSSSGNASASGNSTNWDKYAKNLEYLETLQETGVTNKVFERKLVSHMAKGFDPFKPLSINTSAVEANALMLQKKPGVLYDSLQQHPLHQMKLQQLQQMPFQTPKLHHIATSSNTMVDGQTTRRMEVHKATLANATLSEAQSSSKFISQLPESENPKSLAAINSPLPATINELEETTSISKAASENVVRRLRSTSSLEDNKPMRRISYLRATNNETEFQSEVANTTATNSVDCSKEEMLEEDTEHTYDEVAVVDDVAHVGVISSLDSESIENLSISALDERNSNSTSQSASGNEQQQQQQQQQQHHHHQQQYQLLVLGNSRRSSMNSELRSSLHMEHLSELNSKLETKDVATEMEVFETEMEIKSNCIYGKRISEYRSWKQVKIEIKGDTLKIYPSRSSKSENHLIELDIRNFSFSDETSDKKKFVFRMQSKPTPHLATLGNELNLDDTPASNAGAEQQQHTDILFKTKSITEMRRIFGLLQWKNSLIYDDCNDLQGRQLAEPQKTAASVTMPTATYCDDNVQPQQKQLQTAAEHSPRIAELEPPAGASAAIDSISPVMKTRKSASSKNIPDKDLGSPKAKNWKDLLFRRGGSGSSHSADISPSNLNTAAKTIGSIGVPLRACPMSKVNEYLPNLVDVCTNIVESKGLSVVGIYRIPGNKAAISELSEQVNKSDFSWERCNTDVRWEDVNVVSSLLKLFIRSLPDALLPSSFYPQFIEADKKSGLTRLKELKDLLDSLPRHSYETMKHLIRHLNRVSKNCEVNLMDPRNLAIIFGPSIIRARNDSLEIAVKDMKHQCCIVELLLMQYDYFFENGPLPELSELSGSVASNNSSIVCSSATAAAAQAAQEEQTNMLLHNVAKIERLTERENNSSSSTSTTTTTTRTSRFIPQLRRKAHGKRGGVSSDTYSGESVLSLDYTKNTVLTTSSSSTNTNATSSSSSSSTKMTTSSSKKKERGFLLHSSRSHHRKASLDEKDSGSGSGSGGSIGKEQQRSSVDISTLLTDDESSNSRISDTGSMSLNTVTDTLDIKLRNLRSGSESNEENGSPEFPNKNRRHTFGQPLHLHCENIPYADESPERLFHHVLPALDGPNSLLLNRSCTTALPVTASLKCEMEKKKEEHILPLSVAGYKSSATTHKLQHSSTAPPLNSSAPATIASTPTTVLTLKSSSSNSAPVSIGITGGSARNSYTGNGKNLRFSNSVYEQQCCSEDDSEGSTTSDPKESLVINAPLFFLERYNKKRRERLFRSASFNCRNYQQRHAQQLTNAGSLTKDEKTDMNLTKKRQIQNKQNRSIKRRHTVGGTHDYSTNSATTVGGGVVNVSSSSKHGKCVTTVLRRIPIPSANSNIANNNQSDGGSNGNSSGSGSSGSSGVGVGAPEQVLEVGIRIKNIQRSRY